MTTDDRALYTFPSERARLGQGELRSFILRSPSQSLFRSLADPSPVHRRRDASRAEILVLHDETNVVDLARAITRSLTLWVSSSSLRHLRR